MPVKTVSDDAVEAALWGAHEAVRPKHRVVWPWVLASQAIVLVAGYFGGPYFTSHLTFDKQAMEAQEARVQERAKTYVAEEEAKRTTYEIREKHREPLKKQERARRKNEVTAHVQELEQIARRLREKRDEHLLRLMEQPLEPAPDSALTELDAALEALAAGTKGIASSGALREADPYVRTVEEMKAGVEPLKRKAQAAAGLNGQDRAAMSEQMDETRAALETLKNANRDPNQKPLSFQVDVAQDVMDLLRNLPQGLNQIEQQRKGADHQLGQLRNRFLDEIQREVGHIEQSHRGLLSQKGVSPDVKKVAEALDAMQQATRDQKNSAQWDQPRLDQHFDEVQAAAEGVKARIQAIHDLGKSSETLSLSNLLATQQRQADQQRSAWDRLSKKHQSESKKSDLAIGAAIGKARSQWNRTRDRLKPDQRSKHNTPVDQLLASADAQAKPQGKGAPEPKPGEAFRAEAARMADAVEQTAGEDPAAKQQAAALRKELENLANQIAKGEKTDQKHADEREQQRNRIKKDGRAAQGQLGDKAARISSALKPAAEARDPKLAKVKAGLERLAGQTQRMQAPDGLRSDSVSRELTERSQALGALRQEATKLYQEQRKMQNGVAQDEAARLDRNISSLAASLGRKSGDMARQQTSRDQGVDRQQAALQQALDRVAKGRAKAARQSSTDAKAISELLAAVPEKAAGLEGDAAARKAVMDRISQAQQRAAQWYAKATGQAGTREQMLAEARGQLRRVSEALAAAGYSNQNADAAADLLAATSPEIPSHDSGSLEDAVAAAEAWHGQIEMDFRSLRAAEITARSGQSFEQMRQESGRHSEQRQAIEVPDSDTSIDTVGDLRAYRKAMDTAVARTEGLTQQARTMQRQALGLEDPSLVEALNKARAAAAHRRPQRRPLINVGRDPQGRDPNAYSATQHQMTFDGRLARERKLNVGKIKAEALPGRRFTQESMRRGWLYVDTWYVIGPWENHGKIEWTNIHAPEFEIDLSKAYPGGKAGRKLRWQFTQNPTIRCEVPDEQVNGTYYAYTEVYFDQPRKMLVAIASNDAGKLWINDQTIWQDDGLSIWNMDEGFRTVHFKQGFSKVLMRIENGPRFCQYSLLLCPPDI